MARMKTRSNKLIRALMTSLVLCSSCNFLDLESPNDINAQKLFVDAESAEAALIGLYSSMQSPSYYGGNFLLIGEPLSGNSVTGGFDNNNLDELGLQLVTSSNTMVEEMWYGIYNTIANANHLLEGIEIINDPDFDPSRKAEIKGQALIIRALAHMDLLRFYGEHWDMASSFGIPIIKAVQKPDEGRARATVAETYQAILQDLAEAQPLINLSDRDQSYVNMATIHALQARVYLYMKDYVGAEGEAIQVILDVYFGLLDAPEYGTVFTERKTPESVFELAFDSQNRSRYNGLTYARPDALSTEINFLSSQDLSRFFVFRPGDVRGNLVDSVNNDDSILPNGRTQKYRGEANEDNPAYILRLAEMYLIRAEALGYPAGLNDFNTVRIKRGLGAVDPGSAAAFLEAILDERRAELNFEGHYYFDRARLHDSIGNLFAEPFRRILPIPLREITATNGLVSQNPGY